MIGVLWCRDISIWKKKEPNRWCSKKSDVPSFSLSEISSFFLCDFGSWSFHVLPTSRTRLQLYKQTRTRNLAGGKAEIWHLRTRARDDPWIFVEIDTANLQKSNNNSDLYIYIIIYIHIIIYTYIGDHWRIYTNYSNHWTWTNVKLLGSSQPMAGDIQRVGCARPMVSDASLYSGQALPELYRLETGEEQTYRTFMLGRGYPICIIYTYILYIYTYI